MHARGHKWQVKGLDTGSPWNPKDDEPQWHYQVCPSCELRFDAQAHKCPRCHCADLAGGDHPAHAFGGFVAVRNDTPILEEEDRFGVRSLLAWHPQWNGSIAGRYKLPHGWYGELRRDEEMRWLNEWKEPSEADKRREGTPILHEKARGFWVCPSCGKELEFSEDGSDKGKGRKKPKKASGHDPYGHHKDCARRGQPPKALAITHSAPVSSYRVVVAVPTSMSEVEYQEWGYSLGYSLRTGLRQLYMLEGSEVEFILEPMRESKTEHGKHREGDGDQRASRNSPWPRGATRAGRCQSRGRRLGARSTQAANVYFSLPNCVVCTGSGATETCSLSRTRGPSQGTSVRGAASVGRDSHSRSDGHPR